MGVYVLVMGMLILVMADLSEANWCVCRTDVNDSALQKAIDYACGSGADCTSIHENSACYQPNNVRAHCSYAVNSYFQRKGQGQGTCDFAGCATVTTSDPSTGGGCAYPSTPSNAGTSTGTTPISGTPTTTPPVSGTTPPVSGIITPISGTPSTTLTPPSTFTPTNGGTGIMGGGINSGLGPAGINTDTTSDGPCLILQSTNLFSLLFASLWFSVLLIWCY